MATPVFVGDTTWRRIGHTTTTDPQTLVTTLIETRHGRYDQLQTDWDAMVPGTACTVPGFTALKLMGRGSINWLKTPLPEIQYRFEGIVLDGGGTESPPLSSYRTEERTVRLEAKGAKWDVRYLSPIVEVTYSSGSIIASEQYASKINVKPDPAPISAAPVSHQAQLPQQVAIDSGSYDVDTISGWVNQSEDTSGTWTNIEWHAKILIPS